MELEELVGGAPVGEAEELGEVAERALGRGRAGRRAQTWPCGRSGGRGRRRSSRASTCPRRWAEQPEELAGADLEVDAAQRRTAP